MRRERGERKEQTMEREEAKVESDRVTGVSNVAYDVMVVLSNHLEGIAALQEYKLDAEEAEDAEVTATFDRIEQRYQEGVDELRTLLLSRL
jgi:hypothetical protein